MAAFLNHFSFEFKTGLRNSTLMLMNYLFPLAFYAMMGLVMIPINPDFALILIPTMVVFTMMVSNVLGLPGPLVESREAGIYRSYKINGVPAGSILSIPALTTIFHSIIAATIISLTAAPLFDAVAPANWFYFAGIALLTAITFGGIGALIGVIATGSRSVVLISQLIFLPSILLGGMMIPLQVLPESVQAFSSLFPATYAMEAINSLAYQRETIIPPGLALAVLVTSGLLSFILAVYLFNWDPQNQSRRGHPVLALVSWLPYVAGAILIGFSR